MTAIRKTLSELRSQRWFAANDMRAFSHRQREQQMGLRRTDFMGKPVIAIINTWSELSPCHAHLRDRADAVKRGVLQPGGRARGGRPRPRTRRSSPSATPSLSSKLLQNGPSDTAVSVTATQP